MKEQLEVTDLKGNKIGVMNVSSESLFLGFLKEDLFYFFQINFQDFYFSIFL